MLVSSVPLFADDHHWRLVSNHGIELTTYSDPRQRRIGRPMRGIPGEVIHDSQDTEASAVGQRVADEIQ